MVDLLERIDVMLEQELSAYKTVDYLSFEFQKKLILSRMMMFLLSLRYLRIRSFFRLLL
jgi:hypothetical protein